MGKKKFSALSIIIDNETSWMWSHVPRLQGVLDEYAERVCVYRNAGELQPGDVLFILSCDRILKEDVLALHGHNIVIHASDLPRGRGWSPWTHEVEAGAERMVLTLFEAAQDVDSGDYYFKQPIELEGHELVDELRDLIGTTVVDMIASFLSRYPLPAIPQEGEPTFYPRRTRRDCELDVDKTLREQFNKLRVLDNEKYPAFFRLHGFEYVLRIEKA